MNVRSDSWAAGLDEDQAWTLYYKARKFRDWTIPAKWAVEQFGLERMPGKTAWYAWLDRMDEEEKPHRLAQAALAQAEAKALAKQYDITSEDQVSQLLSVATQAVLTMDDPESAAALISSAMSIKTAQQNDQKLKIEERKLKVKEADLALAREKFEAAERRLQAVQDAVKTAKASKGGLTEETLKKIEEAAGLL